MKRILIFLMALGLISISQASIIVSTTFNSAMGAGELSNFDIVTSPDTLVSFGYNWSNLTTGDTTASGYTTVPHSPSGDFTGLRLEANNGDANASVEGLTVYPKITPSSSSYDFSVDIYASYTSPLAGGGTGSTWHTGICVFSIGTAINTLRDTDLGAPTWSASAYTSQDGISFGYAPDAGDAQSVFYSFEPSTRTGAPNSSGANGQAGTWTGATSVNPGIASANMADPVYFNAIAANYPVGRDTTTAGSQTPGYSWNTLKASVRGNIVSFYINNVRFCDVVSTQTTSKRVGILVTDPYASIASPASQAYVLVDNALVLEFTNTTDVSKANWMLFN